jgi:hypothetical protein
MDFFSLEAQTAGAENPAHSAIDSRPVSASKWCQMIDDNYFCRRQE